MHHHYTHSVSTVKKIISLADSGDISKAEELLNQMQVDAVSSHRGDMLPDIESYTALMDAYIEEQRRLISTIESESSEIVCDVNANELGTVTIMELAEKAQNVLIQMEELSGVSDHFSSMRLSGGNAASSVRNPSLQPTSYHYNAVISAFANAATVAQNTHYASHLIKQAPYMANRWLMRMEAIADTKSPGASGGVAPTVDSYFHVMEAYASSVESRRASIHVQSIFDKLLQNTYYVRPTVREYRLVLRTWCNSIGHKDAAYKTMGVWMRMQRLFKGGNEEMEPTLEDGKMVLEAWTRSK